jgi:hypothetical protein
MSGHSVERFIRGQVLLSHEPVSPPRQRGDHSWHGDAVRLYRLGVPGSDIARHFGVSHGIVSRLVNPAIDNDTVLTDADFIKPHVTRKPRRIIRRSAAVLLACRDFASGKIDRPRLMERIAA